MYELMTVLAGLLMGSMNDIINLVVALSNVRRNAIVPWIRAVCPVSKTLSIHSRALV